MPMLVSPVFIRRALTSVGVMPVNFWITSAAAPATIGAAPEESLAYHVPFDGRHTATSVFPSPS